MPALVHGREHIGNATMESPGYLLAHRQPTLTNSSGNWLLSEGRAEGIMAQR